MGRRSINLTVQPEVKKPTELDTLIDNYYDNNKTLSSYKKLVDSYKETLKDKLTEMELTDGYVNGSGLQASISYSNNDGFDTDKAIEILKETLSKEELEAVIKTREYIDDDALESLIYNKKLDAAVLAPCTIKKPPIGRLYVKPAKKIKE